MLGEGRGWKPKKKDIFTLQSFLKAGKVLFITCSENQLLLCLIFGPYPPAKNEQEITNLLPTWGSEYQLPHQDLQRKWLRHTWVRQPGDTELERLTIVSSNSCLLKVNTCRAHCASCPFWVASHHTIHQDLWSSSQLATHCQPATDLVRATALGRNGTAKKDGLFPLECLKWMIIFIQKSQKKG